MIKNRKINEKKKMKNKALAITTIILVIILWINTEKNRSINSIQNTEFILNAEIELNENNCEYSINEDDIKIISYKGNEGVVIIPCEINGKKVGNINKDAFEDCYNLEKICISKELENIVGEIKYFQIDKEAENEEYIEYITTREYSDVYQHFLSLSEEEKANQEVIPEKFYVPVEKLYSQEMKELYQEASVEKILPNYDLRDNINIKVENQRKFGICYAYASLSSVETNIALTKGEVVDLSEIHFAVMTGYGYGGWFISSTHNYYKGKIGPVYEDDWAMKNIFDNKEGVNDIINRYLTKDKTYTDTEINSLKSEMEDTKAVEYVSQTVDIPSISYSMKNDESKLNNVETIRNKIKQHIMNYGSLYCELYMNNATKYNGYMVMNNKEKNDSYHAVSIIGWDDNFLTTNFPESIRPKENGAYLVLNSWGEEWGNNGYFWVSYEDAYVETCLKGVTKVEDITENITVSSWSIKDKDTEKLLNNNIIIKGQKINININVDVNTMLQNKEQLNVTIRKEKTDLTNNVTISGKNIINQKSNLSFDINTAKLETGTYIIEISYGDETISKQIEIKSGMYDFNINEDGKTITITGYNGTNDILEIQEKYYDYNITKIGEKAFENATIKKVVISNLIYEIGSEAFKSCSKLKEIEIPVSVSSIGNYAFYNCQNLEIAKIYIDDANKTTKTLWGQCAFVNNNSNFKMLVRLGSSAESYAYANTIDYEIMDVARINENAFGYLTIGEAIEATENSTETKVQLLKNKDEQERVVNENLVINSNKDIILDLNKNVIQGNIENNGILKLTNGLIEGKVINTGTVTIGDNIEDIITIKSETDGIYNRGTVNIKGGIIKSKINTIYNIGTINSLTGYIIDETEKGEYKQVQLVKGKEYQVNYYKENLDGTYPSSPSEIETKYEKTDTTVTAKAKTYEGFTYDSTIEGTISSGTVVEDESLVLKLYYKRNTYTINYDNNSGIGKITSQEFKYGEEKNLNKNIFTRENYIFIGWNTKYDGTGISFMDENNMSKIVFENNETITMYAQWIAIPKMLKAVYGQTLENIKLPEGFSWEADLSTSVGEVGENTFTVKYIPEDTENYNILTGIEVTIKVKPRTEIDLGEYKEIRDEETGEKYIENINEGITVQEIKQKLKTNGTIEVITNEDIVEDHKLIGTGMKIKITTEYDETIVYTVVITGDITGDGMINDADLLLLVRYKVGFEREKELVTGAKLRATDIVKDTNFATDGDLLKLAKILVGLSIF